MSIKPVLSFLKYPGSQPETADEVQMPTKGSDTSRDSTVNDFTQDRKCTYNVTLRRVCATIVAVEK